ncbi:MAG: hypothetical protein ABI112_15275, partial [Terracoccus sp.]
MTITTTKLTRAAGVAAITAAVLASLMLGPSAASAATLNPAPTLSAVRSELDAALNDVVAAGVPGIIVRVQDPHPSVRNRVVGVGVDDLHLVGPPGVRWDLVLAPTQA